VDSADETLQLFRRGIQNRTTRETKCNGTSSRSHGIFSIRILKNEKETGGSIATSTLCFLDLGGSESKTESIGTKEGIYINKSLSNLTTVVHALSKGLPIIPYNNDPLTVNLKDAFEGNAEIIVLACISPSDAKCNRIMRTLDYVKGMKKIQPPVRAAETNSNPQLHKEEATGNPGKDRVEQSETGRTLSQKVETLEKEVKELKLIISSRSNNIVMHKRPPKVTNKETKPKEETPRSSPPIKDSERKVLIDVTYIMFLCNWLAFNRNETLYKSFKTWFCGKPGFWNSDEKCPKNLRNKIQRIISYFKYIKEHETTIGDVDETLVSLIRTRFTKEIIAAVNQLMEINGRIVFDSVIDINTPLNNALLQML
jgi:hypothetical protein